MLTGINCASTRYIFACSSQLDGLYTHIKTMQPGNLGELTGQKWN